jgi:HEAT repeat protein
LGHLPGTSNQNALVQSLNDTRHEVRRESIEALARIGQRSHLNVLMQVAARETDSGLRTLAQKAAEQLVSQEQKDHSDDALLLSSNDPMERVAAIERMQESENWNFTTLFVEATNDTHPAVRQAAILGLGRLGDDRALDALLSLVQTADGKHQHAAVGAVAQLQNQTSLPNLYPLTRSEDPLMRQYSVRALGWMPNSASIPLLKERSQDPEEKVRMEALLALTRFEGLPTADALLAFMNDELVYIRSEAARLMGKSPGEGVAAALIQALQDSDALVRINSASSLSSLGEIGSIEALRTCIHKADTPEEAQYYKKAISDLGGTLESE